MDTVTITQFKEDLQMLPITPMTPRSEAIALMQQCYDTWKDSPFVTAEDRENGMEVLMVQIDGLSNI